MALTVKMVHQYPAQKVQQALLVQMELLAEMDLAFPA
tara:strand:- start:123 stop:233 length:111 start_codon:yes stop_codon:yes gene_type:complete